MPRNVHDGIRKRCDCPTRKWAKCPHGWHFGFHHAGVEHRYSLDKVARARREQPPTSKTAAEAWRDRLRDEIRTGTFVDPDAPPPPAPDAPLSFGDVCDRYMKEFVGKLDPDEDGSAVWSGENLRPRTAVQAEYQLRLTRACEVAVAGGLTVRLEQKPVGSVTKADIEAVRKARKAHGTVGCNRLLARLRHLFNWAIAEGLTDRTPFKVSGVVVVKIATGKEQARDRRLNPGEEDALLHHAGPHMRSLIVAALSTGCRVGELLSLQWSQIRRDETGEARWLDLRAAKTKSKKTRVIPIGPRLAAELTMRRHAPDGKEHPLGAYVFGDETGGRIASVQKAWRCCVLRAHGHAPKWVKGKPGRMAPESLAALREINLKFHDLRREFGSSLLESSAGLHDVQAFLGHANITTTSRYLATSPMRLERALARMEGGEDEKADPIRTTFAQTGAATETPAKEPDAKVLH
jgi:integrase